MSLHTRARAELSAWTPESPDQLALRDGYLAHLDKFQDAVWRSCLPGHLTAGTIIVDERAEHTLLVLHGRLNLWVQPGGHCEDGDESLAATAAREGREETGVEGLVLSAHPTRLSQHAGPCGADYHFDVQFAAVAPAGATPIVSDESHDVRWFPVDALPAELANDVPDSVAAAVTAVRGRGGNFRA